MLLGVVSSGIRVMMGIVPFVSALFLFPSLASAQFLPRWPVTDFRDLSDAIVFGILRPLPPVLIGIGVVVFFWGVIKYIRSGANENMAREGTKIMTYGVIGVFVMVSLWGLVALLVQLSGFRGTNFTPPDVIHDPGGLLN